MEGQMDCAVRSQNDKQGKSVSTRIKSRGAVWSMSGLRMCCATFRHEEQKKSCPAAVILVCKSAVASTFAVLPEVNCSGDAQSKKEKLELNDVLSKELNDWAWSSEIEIDETHLSLLCRAQGQKSTLPWRICWEFAGSSNVLGLA